MEKHKKFLTIREAIRDIIDSLVRPDCVEEIAEIFSFLEGGSAGTTQGIHPLAENKAPGIIYQPKESDEEEFYHWREFEDLLTRALDDKLPEDIAIIYTKVFWVHSCEGLDTERNEKGIWVETEMEKFRCKQCGHCCLNLTDAYCNSVLDEDVNRWKSEDRDDILKFVDQSSFFNDIWIDQETGEELGRCPWLKKLSNNKYTCRIHHTKPTHCRNYPHSKRHALTTGCKGFDPD
ncbi:MAG: YkgJ family cysteine cluster protein [Desulfobacterales bacterium]|jgi:Fe-S-cluster containining protein